MEQPQAGRAPLHPARKLRPRLHAVRCAVPPLGLSAHRTTGRAMAPRTGAQRMTRKARKPAKQPTPDDAQARERAQLLARMTLAPEVNAAGIADVFNVTGKPDVSDLIGELRERGDAILRGDTKGIERMLASQAYALNA